MNTISDKKELAVNLKHNGYNCAQAVLCAFAEESGLPADTLKNLGSSFGIGMGCMEGTCGALIAAEMLLGLKEAKNGPVIQKARAIHTAFTEKSGGSLCKDLKGRDTGHPLCHCDDCVRNATEITEKFM